jgi:anti-anti-sigma factor
VLVVHGDLDLLHAAKLAVAAGDALRHCRRLVIDLCRADFVDSCGLAALMNVKRRAARANAHLAVACDVSATLRLLATTRLDRTLEVHPSVEAAIDRLVPPQPIRRSA